MTWRTPLATSLKKVSPRAWLYTKSMVSCVRRALYTMDFPVTYYPNLKAIYLQVPKTATSTTSALLLTKLGIAFDASNYHSIHAHSTPFFIDEERLRELRQDRTIFTFAFVRDPYTRLISCYKDKIKLEQDIDIMQDYFGLFTPDMNFADFVRVICRIPNFWANTHFKSQTSFLYFKGQPAPDFIGKFENYAQDITFIQKKLELSSVTQSFNVTAGTYDLSEWYDSDLKRLVYKRFKEDFDRLGYDKQF